MKQNSLKSIKVKILYDDVLKNITGKNEEITWVNEGISFIMILLFIFSSYPDIQKKYPPGKIGFLLNNKPPKKFDILNDGDEIKVLVSEMEILKEC